MAGDPQTLVLLVAFAVLTVGVIVRLVAKRGRRTFPSCRANYLWLFFLFFVVTECVAFQVGVWVLALLCFWALREFFSLLDFRFQDRWAILGAYAAIPFMTWFIQTQWYGMFIISIPVYAFLIVPFLVALGGRDSRGAVLSIGAIDLGLFFFVYCLGHVAYLASYSTWMAVMLIANVFLCDGVGRAVVRWGPRAWGRLASVYCGAAPLTVGLSVLLSGWTGIPTGHAAAIGAMIPALVLMGDCTIAHVMSDLGISEESLAPGKGEILVSIRPVFYTGPVVFHYIRYFLT